MSDKKEQSTEDFKKELFARVKAGYWDNTVKAYKKAHDIPLTDRKNAHPERDIQNACLQWLTLNKVCHVRLAVNSSLIFVGGKPVRLPNPLKGWPDVLCIIGGRAVGVEVKANTKQSDEQIAVQKRIEAAGGLYAVVHSVEELEAFIKPLLTSRLPAK